jgi:dATP pyrophosphohydrolase
MLHNRSMNKRKVQVVLFTENDAGKKNFLLLKTNERRGQFWQSVTGSVEEGESFEAAAFREVAEETNCSKENVIAHFDLAMDFKFKDQWGFDVVEKIFAFKINQDFILKLDPNEHIESMWVNEDQITSSSVKFESNYKAIEKCKEF